MELTEERKDALQIFLHENEIDVCWLQESHLNNGKSLKIKGYQEPIRNDRLLFILFINDIVKDLPMRVRQHSMLMILFCGALRRNRAQQLLECS